MWGLSITCANTIWLVFVISSSCLLLLQTSPSDVGPLQLLNQEYLAIICNKCQRVWTEASRKCSGQKTHWHSFMQICTTGGINHEKGGSCLYCIYITGVANSLLPEYEGYNEQKAICWQIVPCEVQSARLTSKQGSGLVWTTPPLFILALDFWDCLVLSFFLLKRQLDLGCS